MTTGALKTTQQIATLFNVVAGIDSVADIRLRHNVAPTTPVRSTQLQDGILISTIESTKEKLD